MRATLAHECRYGGQGQLVRSVDAVGLPHWRCHCGTFFVVYDGALSAPSGTTEAQ